MRSAVFVTASVGYFFYIDSAGTFVYSKTTDGGVTWGAAVTIASATTHVAYDVWFDQWTPGDAGTLIHTWFFDVTNDAVRWRTLDTAADTLGTQRTVFTGASSVAGRGAFVTGAKTKSGYLYCAYDIDAGAEKGVHRSTDGGTTWSASLSATFVEATIDQCLAFPASGTGDDNDCWFLYHDASADALTLKMWDSSAAAQVESATIVTVVENATDLTGQYAFAASVRHSDGHLIVAAVSQPPNGSAIVFSTWDLGGTGSITAKGQIVAAIAANDQTANPQVFIDQTTDNIYVAYNSKRDSTELWNSASKVYYTKSTDGGTTWSAGDTAYMQGATAAVVQVWTPLMGPRFLASWRVGTTLVTNAANSLSFAASGITADSSKLVPLGGGITATVDVAASSSKTVAIAGVVTVTVAPVVADSSKEVPIGGSATAAVAIATQSTKQVPIAGSASAAVDVAAQSTKQTPIAGSSTAVVAVAAQSAKLVPIAGAATATVLVQPQSSLPVPVGGSASAAVLAQAQTTKQVPIGGSITGVVGNPPVIADSLAQVPIGGSAALTIAIAALSTRPVPIGGSSVAQILVTAQCIGAVPITGLAAAMAGVSAQSARSVPIGGLVDVSVIPLNNGRYLTTATAAASRYKVTGFSRSRFQVAASHRSQHKVADSSSSSLQAIVTASPQFTIRSTK